MMPDFVVVPLVPLVPLVSLVPSVPSVSVIPRERSDRGNLTHATAEEIATACAKPRNDDTRQRGYRTKHPAHFATL